MLPMGLGNEDRRSSIGCAKAKDLADEALSVGWWPQPAGEASEGTGRKEVETVSKSACGIETVRSLRWWVVRRGLCDSGGKYCIPYAGGITKEKGGHSLEKTGGVECAYLPEGRQPWHLQEGERGWGTSASGSWWMSSIAGLCFLSEIGNLSMKMRIREEVLQV